MERPNVHSGISGKLILMNIIKKFRLAWYIMDNYLAHKCLPNSIILQTRTEMAAVNFNISIQINHQPDATIFQFIILTFIYSRPRTQHGCHHDKKVKPEAATAVIELLMMGGKTPETC
jgi:hypothetical protein